MTPMPSALKFELLGKCSVGDKFATGMQH